MYSGYTAMIYVGYISYSVVYSDRLKRMYSDMDSGQFRMYSDSVPTMIIECTPIYTGWNVGAETDVLNSRGRAKYTKILYSILYTVKSVISVTNGDIITMYKTLYKHNNV